jgi:hypothetical protein
MAESWFLWIDIEGFGARWNNDNAPLQALNALMTGIFRIGTRLYSEPPDRLFAHHMGDGFVLLSDYPEASLDRAVAIAVALLRHVAVSSGMFAKAALSEGEIADIKGCYPREVTAIMDSDTAFMGAGLMTVFPVMGTGLIRANGLHGESPSGPLLVVDDGIHDRIGKGFPKLPVAGPTGRKMMSIDWLRSSSDVVRTIQTRAALSAGSNGVLEQQLQDYCAGPVPDRWKAGVRDFLKIKV